MPKLPVVVGQIPVCWSAERNAATVTDVIHQTEPGSLLVLPEAALSGYDDDLSGFADLDAGQVADARHAVSDAAVHSGIHVVCGTLLYENGSWWNAGIYFSPTVRQV